jgi:peptidoglycan/xylan/chitin deacetylase (PgdA/CDA1 family)
MLRGWVSRWAPGLLIALAAGLGSFDLLSPLSAVLGALAGLALLSVGVFFPATGLYADWYTRVLGGGVALSFDDGPHPQSTRRVLAALDEHSQHATFFVIGWKVEARPDVVREIAARGHAIGVHGFDHDRLHALQRPEQVAQDIRRSQEAVRRACGVTPTLFRPPLGFVSPFTADGARRAGVTLVGWSQRAFDGVSRTRPEGVLRRIERKLRPGDIVLLHDAAETERFTPAGVAALPEILGLLHARGLRSVALSARNLARAAASKSPLPEPDPFAAEPK